MRIGDTVTRFLGGHNPKTGHVCSMNLKVTKITDAAIHCGPWTFCPATGAEIDKELGWGPPPMRTGSVIVPPGVEPDHLAPMNET